MRSTAAAVSSLLACVLLTGCASSPYVEDKLAYPETSPLSDEAQVEKLSYLGRGMMAAKNRSTLEARISDSPRVKTWQDSRLKMASDVSGSVSLVADLAESQYGSMLGTQAGVAGFAAGLIASSLFNGSMDRVGQAFLPAEMYGRSLDTREDAEWALHRLVTERADAIAKGLAWEVECQAGCAPGSSHIAYHYAATPGNGLPEEFIYKPTEFGMRVQFAELEPVDPADPVGAFLDFTPRWKTGPGYTLDVRFVTDFKKNYGGEPGELVYLKAPDGNLYPDAWKELGRTRLGIASLMEFHSTPYTFSGNGTSWHKLFFYDGGGYTFTHTNRNLHIKERMHVPTLPHTGADMALNDAGTPDAL